MLSKKPFIFGMFFGTVLLVAYLFSLPDGRLHIVFCDVDQGDAAYIRTPSKQDVLIDGGPNDKVLACLGKNMPFYDRTIDLVILSHAQKDHLQGLISVVERYKVKNFVIGVVGNETEGYKKLVEVIKEKNIPVKNLYKGDSFSLGEVKFSVLWPDQSWIAGHLSPPISDPSTSLRTGLSDLSGKQVLGQSSDSDLNNFSYYFHLSYGSFDALFTGDGDRKIQPAIMKSTQLPDVEVLKFPHHGSKTGVMAEFLDQIKPELAIISVGKNSYGHPTKEALKLLSDRAVEIKRTDLEGNVEIVSDGKGW